LFAFLEPKDAALAADCPSAGAAIAGIVLRTLCFKDARERVFDVSKTRVTRF
jgi:hypothetical protein